MIDAITSWILDFASRPISTGKAIIIALLTGAVVALIGCIAEDKPIAYFAKGDKQYILTFKGIKEVIDE